MHLADPLRSSVHVWGSNRGEERRHTRYAFPIMSGKERVKPSSAAGLDRENSRRRASAVAGEWAACASYQTAESSKQRSWSWERMRSRRIGSCGRRMMKRSPRTINDANPVVPLLIPPQHIFNALDAPSPAPSRISILNPFPSPPPVNTLTTSFICPSHSLRRGQVDLRVGCLSLGVREHHHP